MPGRTPSQAVRAFVDPLNLARSTVTRAVLGVSPGGYDAGGVHTLAFQEGPVRLRAEYADLELASAIGYSVVETEDQDRGPWKAKTESYLHTLSIVEGDEVISFQWHPLSAVTTPHLHLGPTILGQGLTDLGRRLSKAHVPTGRISLEQVLRFAIRDLGVRRLRDDWEAILDATQAAFEQWRMWG